MDIEWKVIKRYPDYEVSSDGRIRSNRLPVDGRKPSRDRPFVMKSLNREPPNEAPRPYVCLCLPGERKSRHETIARLVAEAFIPNPESLQIVAHRDGVSTNNAVDNLKWSSVRDNTLDMWGHGTMLYGEKQKTSKLTREQVLSIRTDYYAGMNRDKMSAKYGVSKCHLFRIAKGTAWGWLIECGGVGHP